MPKKRLTNTQRLDKIEYTLVDYKEELKLINKKFDNHLTHLSASLDDATKFINESRECMTEVKNQLNEIINIQVNGTKGFKNVILEIYAITAASRSTRKMINSIKEWFTKHKTLKTILTSKPIKIIFNITLTVLTLNLLEYLGLDINLVKEFLNATGIAGAK